MLALAMSSSPLAEAQADAMSDSTWLRMRLRPLVVVPGLPMDQSRAEDEEMGG